MFYFSKLRQVIAMSSLSSKYCLKAHTHTYTHTFSLSLSLSLFLSLSLSLTHTHTHTHIRTHIHTLSLSLSLIHMHAHTVSDLITCYSLNFHLTFSMYNVSSTQFVNITSISLIFICLFLPPDSTWHKVNDLKVDYSVEGKVGHDPWLEPCWAMLVLGPLSAMWAWWA